MHGQAEIVSKQDNRESLLGAAKTVAARAYAPYSNIQVGAALLADNGEVYVGCNVENASFPVGNCAERNAIANAVAVLGPELRIVEIAVIAYRAGEPMAITPCGACRQAIREFADQDTVIHFGDALDHSVGIAELLPYAFKL